MMNGPGVADHPLFAGPPSLPATIPSRPMRFRIPLLIASALVSACSSRDATSSGAATGGTFVQVGIGDATDLFPPLVNEANARVVQDLVFDRLAEIGPDMSTVGDKGFTPRLAKSWTWAPDSMSIAFSIDPRAKWHDGQ